MRILKYTLSAMFAASASAAISEQLTGAAARSEALSEIFQLCETVSAARGRKSEAQIKGEVQSDGRRVSAEMGQRWRRGTASGTF
jgi:hypothetical protein